MRMPGVIRADSLADEGWPRVGLDNGKRWVVARPEPFWSVWERLRVTWMVFTGRADALLWTDQ